MKHQYKENTQVRRFSFSPCCLTKIDHHFVKKINPIHMKKILSLLVFVLAQFASYGQCSSVAVQVSSSDTTSIQLYHAGFFLMPSGFDNICEWEVSSFSGEILHQATTSGNANEQGFTLFDHSIPLTDSMKATIVITNNTEGITCTMTDTLYWKETEVLPGSFIGNWAVLSSNGGVEEPITTSTNEIQSISTIALFPSPAYDYFELRGDLANYAFSIFDLNGQHLASYHNVYQQEKVDVSHFSAGMYFVHIWDEQRRYVGVKKMIKL